MSEFPYTDQQVDQFAKAGGGLLHDYARGMLAVLHAEGVTVTFPEPRFYVLHSGIKWTVMELGKRLVADFYGGEAAGEDAHKYAARLNREAQS